MATDAAKPTCGNRCAARQLLTLPGLRSGASERDAATVFWLTTDWSYWRALYHPLAFSADAVEGWTHDHYTAAFLDHEPEAPSSGNYAGP